MHLGCGWNILGLVFLSQAFYKHSFTADVQRFHNKYCFTECSMGVVQAFLRVVFLSCAFYKL